MAFTETYSRDGGVYSLEVSTKRGDPWRLVKTPKTSGAEARFVDQALIDGFAFGGEALAGVSFVVEALADRPGFRIASQPKDSDRLAKRDMRKWLSCAVDLIRESGDMSAPGRAASSVSWLHDARERGLLPQEGEAKAKPKTQANSTGASLAEPEALITPEQMIEGVRKVVGSYAAEQFGLFLKERENQRRALAASEAQSKAPPAKTAKLAKPSKMKP